MLFLQFLVLVTSERSRGGIASRIVRRMGEEDGKVGVEWRDGVTGCWRSAMVRDGGGILLRGYEGRL